ncbi:MAG: hypothetical protein RJQ00_04145 [Vicingaceae bacterium]
MTTLITLLISLLGYGTPADYADYTEDQLNTEIAEAQDGGIAGEWDTEVTPSDPDNGGE